MGFSERFPRWITALIAIGQLAVTAAIVALEVLSIFVDLAHGTIYAGFWCGLIFIATFMMMFFISEYIDNLLCCFFQQANLRLSLVSLLLPWSML